MKKNSVVVASMVSLTLIFNIPVQAYADLTLLEPSRTSRTSRTSASSTIISDDFVGPRQTAFAVPTVVRTANFLIPNNPLSAVQASRTPGAREMTNAPGIISSVQRVSKTQTRTETGTATATGTQTGTQTGTATATGTQTGTETGTATNLNSRTASLDTPCPTAICGVTEGQTVSGRVMIQPNLTLNPDIRKVFYYLNGASAGKEYAAPFTWGGVSGFDTTQLADGAYTLAGTYTTLTGDQSFSITFTVSNNAIPPADTEAPLISEVVSNNVFSSDATISWTTSEAGDSQVEYRILGTSAWVVTGIQAALVVNHVVGLSGLSAGSTYEFRVKSKDAAGNLATQATISSLTTLTNCATVMCGVTTNETVSGTVMIQPNLAINPDIQKVFYYLNGTLSGKEYAPLFTWGGANGFDTTQLENGVYSLGGTYTTSTGDHAFGITFTVRNGNTLPPSGTDTTAPVVSGLNATVNADKSVTVTARVDDLTGSYIYYQAKRGGTSSFQSSGQLTNGTVLLQWNPVFQPGTYDYWMEFTNPAGLVTHTDKNSFEIPSAIGAGPTTNVEVQSDTTPPVISVQSFSVSNNTVTVNATIDDFLQSAVYFSQRRGDAAVFFESILNRISRGSLNVQWENFEPGTYDYWFEFTNDVGLLTRTDKKAFEILITSPGQPTPPTQTDTTAPVVTGLTATVNGDNSVTITARVDDFTGTYVYHQSRRGGTGSFESSNPLTDGIVSLAWRPVFEPGTYDYWVEFTNSVGLVTRTATNSFEITRDTIAPGISAMDATDVTSSGATVYWTTNEAGDSAVEYRIRGTTAWSSTSINPSLVTTHSVALSGLNAGTTYEYRVKSRDTAGNLSNDMNVFNFKTAGLVIPCTTAICGVTAGQIVSGTVMIQPNLTLNPDIRKVFYYLNGASAGKEYAPLFTWGGENGFDTTQLEDGVYTLAGTYTTSTGDQSFSITFTVGNNN